LFQLFNYKDVLPAVLDGFDKMQANAMKTVSTILRRAYRSISSKSESQKNRWRTKGKKSQGGNSQEYWEIQTLVQATMALLSELPECKSLGTSFSGMHLMAYAPSSATFFFSRSFCIHLCHP
jgi:hypothetical protein